MSSAASFEKQVESFIEVVINNPDRAFEQFSRSFSNKSKLSDSQVEYFIQSASKEILSENGLKKFSNAISSDLNERIFKCIGRRPTDQQKNLPESLRAYIALRYCKSRKLPVTDTLQKMEKLEIEGQLFRYKFAAWAVKQNVSEFTNELGDFRIKDSNYLRLLAETALYFDANAFFSDLNEFDLLESSSREEFYLRGLVRSVSAIESIVEDSFFLESLEDFPSDVLEWIYETFEYGKTFIQDSIEGLRKPTRKLPKSKPFSEYPEFAFLPQLPDSKETVRKKSNKDWVLSAKESSIFTIFILKAYPKFEINEMGFDDSDFFGNLTDREKLPLMAILLLLKSLDNSIEAIEDEMIREFIQELHSLRDPTTRFAAVAVALMKNANMPHFSMSKSVGELAFDLTFCTSFKGSNKRLYSIVLSICNKLGIGADSQKILEKKWKNVHFQKYFLIFLAELFFTEKVASKEKVDILIRFFNTTELQTESALKDFSFCLSSGLSRGLSQGLNPRQILSERELFFINRLGTPFQLALTPDEFKKLQFTQEISYYAQALEKLSERDKERMVPAFFQFLKALADSSMGEKRWTPELREIFDVYSLSKEIWNQETRATVKEISDRFSTSLESEEEPFNISNELHAAFEYNHLDKKQYKHFYQAAVEEGVGLPLLDGKIFGKYSKGTDVEKNLAVQHLLSRLFILTEPKEQLRIIQQLSKNFPPEHEFRIQLASWIKALNRQISLNKKSFDDYKIIRSNDPYILFRIGSIAGESCQRVTGDPSNNKCLLSYPLDGKNQVIFAEDHKGKIEARAILRFFYACDPPRTDNPIFPVLFLEPFYPAGADVVLRKAMTLSAIQCAKELNIPLIRRYKKNERKEGQHKYDLLTVNGAAPFEYFDGLGTKIKENDETRFKSKSTFRSWIDRTDLKILFDPSQTESWSF